MVATNYDSVVVGRSLAVVACLELSGDVSADVLALLTSLETPWSTNEAAARVVEAVTSVLLRPVAGRRADAVTEVAARLAARAAKRLTLPADRARLLLGGVAVHLNRPVSEEAVAALLETCVALFEGDVWKKLVDPTGRSLVAAVTKGAADYAAETSNPRHLRSQAMRMLQRAVETSQQGWRDFLPGLFSRLYGVAAAPSWSPKDGSLRADAVSAAAALVVAAVPKKERRRLSALDAVAAMKGATEPADDLRDRLRAYVPPMLVRARRDPSAASRMAAVEAASKLLATGYLDEGVLADTLIALRFDDEAPEVARAAAVALRALDSPEVGVIRDKARRVSGAARSGDERALIDALSALRFGDAADAVADVVDALCDACDVDPPKMAFAALEPPLGPPNFLVVDDDTRAMESARLGAAFHKPNFKWLRLPRARDAARRACWLLVAHRSDDAMPLVADRCIELLQQDKSRPSPALVLDEAMQAAAGRARLSVEGLVTEEPDVDDTAGLVAVADCVADEVLLLLSNSSKVVPPAQPDEVRGWLRDGTPLREGHQKKKPMLEGEEDPVSAALCCVLARACELALAGGGRRAWQPLLRRVLYPLLEKLASPSAATRQAALGSLVMIAALSPHDETSPDALAALLSQNMDYVVEAACRRLRKAKTAQGAGEAAAVVEALLRHSRCSLATPLLRDVVQNALRDIDEHCLDGAHYAAPFAQLMRAMLNSLPSQTVSAPKEAPQEDWLERVDVVMKPETNALDEQMKQAYLDARIDVMNDKNVLNREEEVKDGRTMNERMYRKTLEDQQKQMESDPPDPTAEEELVLQVLKRATYFVSPHFDLRTRRLGLEVLAEGVQRIRSNAVRVRPLVHQVWPAIRARFPKAGDDLENSEASHCLAAALDVVASFVEAVGDFLSFKFNEDLMPSLDRVLDTPLEAGQLKAPRRRLLEAALRCILVFSDRRDCAYLVRPYAARVAELALARLNEDDVVPPSLVPLVKSLATHDADGIWHILACKLPNADNLPRVAPLASFPCWHCPSALTTTTNSVILDLFVFVDTHTSKFARLTLW